MPWYVPERLCRIHKIHCQIYESTIPIKSRISTLGHILTASTDTEGTPHSISPFDIEDHSQHCDRFFRLLDTIQLSSLHSQHNARSERTPGRDPESPTIRQTRRNSSHIPGWPEITECFDQHDLWAWFDCGSAIVVRCCEYYYASNHLLANTES